MRSFQVFAAMPPERAIQMLRSLEKEARGVFAEAVQAACLALKVRPVYLKRQPFEKRADSVRRALSRVASNAVADEVLAVYFLQCRRELLTEWLDLAGIPHEDGSLLDDVPEAPPEAALGQAVKTFREADTADPDRELLLHAFAAQEAIQWAALEARLGAIR